jgi:hydrogenase/urease accessory protein HupE
VGPGWAEGIHLRRNIGRSGGVWRRMTSGVKLCCSVVLTRLRLAGILALWLAFVSTALGHNPDTSYTRVKITPELIEFKFTFDVITLLKIVDLDENHDHQVTREELNRSAPKIYEFIRRHVKLSIDDKDASFGDELPAVFSENAASVPENIYHQTLAHFTFHKQIAVLPEGFELDYEIFDTLGDRHTNLGSIEEGTERIDEIVFTKFEPQYTYYLNHPPSMQTQLAQFFTLGVKHIFLGYDHILFLLALLVLSRFWDLVKIITAFTVAHTITLILAALELVKLPSRLIETGIAMTIMYVALENLWIKKTSHRWMLTFAFGLVHGFGFANVLRDLGLPTNGLMLSLLSFNVGVEAAQVTIVLALLPVSLWLGRQPYGHRAKLALSMMIFLVGTAWFIDRAFNLRLMPF